MRFTLETIIPNDLKQNVAMVGAEKTDKDRGLTWKLVAQRVENDEVELYIKCTSIQKFSPFSCEVELQFGNDLTRVAHFDNCKTKCQYIHLPLQNLPNEFEFGKLLSVVVDLKNFERDGKAVEVETLSQELAQPTKRFLDDNTTKKYGSAGKKKRVNPTEQWAQYRVAGMAIPVVKMEIVEDAEFKKMLSQMAQVQKMPGNEQSGMESSVLAFATDDQISMEAIRAQVQQGLAPLLGAPINAPTGSEAMRLSIMEQVAKIQKDHAPNQKAPNRPECGDLLAEKRQRLELRNPVAIDATPEMAISQLMESFGGKNKELLVELSQPPKMPENGQSDLESSVAKYIADSQKSLNEICAQLLPGLPPNLGAPKIAEKDPDIRNPVGDNLRPGIGNGMVNMSARFNDLVARKADDQAPKSPESSESGDFEYLPTDEELKEKIWKLESENKKLQQNYDGLQSIFSIEFGNADQRAHSLQIAKSEVETLKKAVDSVEEENLSLKFKLRNLEQSREQDEQKISELSKDLEAMRVNSDASVEMEQLEVELEKSKAQASKYADEVVYLSYHSSQVEEQLKKVEGAQNQRVADLEQQLEQVREELAAEKKKVESLEGHMALKQLCSAPSNMKLLEMLSTPPPPPVLSEAERIRNQVVEMRNNFKTVREDLYNKTREVKYLKIVHAQLEEQNRKLRKKMNTLVNFCALEQFQPEEEKAREVKIETLKDVKNELPKLEVLVQMYHTEREKILPQTEAELAQLQKTCTASYEVNRYLEERVEELEKQADKINEKIGLNLA